MGNVLMDELRKVVSGRLTEQQSMTSWKLLSKLAKEFAGDAKGVSDAVERKDAMVMVHSVIWTIQSIAEFVEEFYDVADPSDAVVALRNAEKALERYEKAFLAGLKTTTIR